MMASSNLNRSSSNRNLSSGGRKQQLSSLILFASVVVFVNLCPFQQDFQDANQDSGGKLTRTGALDEAARLQSIGLSLSGSCVEFVRLMFTNPIRLGKRATRFTQADAAMLGKMAKVWYIKKKIKKLGKKLKKHTIAVPVFTAIPIYEHTYYPQHPHMTHLSHHHGHHHGAASSYAPTFVAAATSNNAASSSGHQLASSASSTHQQTALAPTFRMSPNHRAMFQPHPQQSHHNRAHYAAAQNQIINSYVPSPPLYVDEAGGLYGHYGNAYGRYDGGYQLWQ